MAIREISGDIHHPNTATPWAHARVSAELLTAFATTAQAYPTATIHKDTDATGACLFELAVPDTGSAPYRFTLPDGTRFRIAIGAGEPTTIAALYNAAQAGAPPADPQALQAAIDAHASTVASSANLGHIRPDGTTITVDPQTGIASAVAGISAATPTITKIAGASLGGHRAVILDSAGAAFYADPLTGLEVAGITTAAALVGETITIQTFGELAEPSWAWAPGPVYLGPLGTLTQTTPAAGACLQLGIATAPTRILIRIQPPILL